MSLFKKEKKSEIEITNETDQPLTTTKRKAILKVVEIAHKSLKKLKTAVKETEEDKKRIIEILKSLSNAMDIEDEKTGEPYTMEDYQKMSAAELAQLSWDALKYFSKNFLTKEETDKIFNEEVKE